jgi:hypothetical protein
MLWMLWMESNLRGGGGGGGVVSNISFQGDKKEWKYVRTTSSILLLIIGTGFP